MRNILFITIGLLLVLFSSCGQYIYKSTTVRTALLTKQNDFNVQLNAGGAGGEIYAAYSPINNVGFSAAYASSVSSDTANRKKSRFSDVEFAAFPYYAKDKLRLEMPVGVGFTNRKALDTSSTTFSPYSRIFIQPTIGVSWESFEMAFFCRISDLNYSDTRFGTDRRFEPGIMLRGASKNIKAMLQFRTDYGTNNSKAPGTLIPYNQQVEYLPFHLSFGMSLSFNASDLMGKKKITP